MQRNRDGRWGLESVRDYWWLAQSASHDLLPSGRQYSPTQLADCRLQFHFSQDARLLASDLEV